MALDHFAHEHPLTLSEEWDEGICEECSGCRYRILGPSFRCTECNDFILHKSCAQLLAQLIEHPWHHEHPLTLIYTPDHYERYGCRCEKAASLVYECPPCAFHLDVAIAQAQTVEHACHQHPLTLQVKKASFCCDACGTTHKVEGFAYHCAACHFWVHEMCILLPNKVKHTSHDHPLSLSHSFQFELSMFNNYCDICGDYTYRENCVYYCRRCKFFSHVKCAMSMTGTDQRDKEPECHSPSVISLPMPDVSGCANLIKHLLDQWSLASDKCWKEVKDCSCDQHLTLFDTQTDKICDACVLPISAPYYNCPECNLILHKSCAELPYEIRHPLHRKHPLTLVHGVSFCNNCLDSGNGFAYHCANCHFSVDIKCASLPTAIRHEAHKHLLNFERDDNLRCSACYESQRSMYKCSTCNFNLDIACALLPRTLKPHRYDDHSLLLTYSPSVLITEENYCEVCEVEMNTKLWFYYCAKCDRTYERECICKVVNEYPNMKLGKMIKVSNHPHPLTLARKENHNLATCGYCNDFCDAAAFECKECPFNLCFYCCMDLLRASLAKTS